MGIERTFVCYLINSYTERSISGLICDLTMNKAKHDLYKEWVIEGEDVHGLIADVYICMYAYIRSTVAAGQSVFT